MSDLVERLQDMLKLGERQPIGKAPYLLCGEAAEEIERLTKLIADAPHDLYCAGDIRGNKLNAPCNCWKSKVNSDE